MTLGADVNASASTKVLVGSQPESGLISEMGSQMRPASAPRLATEPETAADDLVRLVLAVVETLRQVMERQAIRRVESGALSEEEVERLGLTLLRLEERMAELKSRFGMEQDDLSLRLGSVQDFMDVLSNEGGTEGSDARCCQPKDSG